jgi:transposase
VVATEGNATDFKHGRQFAAWLGAKAILNRGHIKMGRITKQCDQYLRTLLVHGARTVLINAAKHSGRINQWVTQLIARYGFYRPDHIVTMV